ncbi:GyrI-like domain-containing protein [Thalassovita sp.]|uniref:GyrI-like domain-containing protein n=1 Tax=Thalassovita sp. TaxID=1979401 RepID=UPI002B273E04|nr:GyrI-like domain-containing protein [Thalassovita sp.]
MDKLDFKKTDKPFYSGRTGRWDRVRVPQMTFLAIEGQGDPNGAAYAASIAALYPLAYAIKFSMKAEGRDFVVPPLEALWWADDMAAFVAGDRAHWRWKAMLRMPEAVTEDMLNAAYAKTLAKLVKAKDSVTDADHVEAVGLWRFEEGDCLQTLHSGSYADEAPVLAALHHEVMPGMGLTFAGDHHEIYLSDPRRVAPEKLKTILRQPVKPA